MHGGDVRIAEFRRKMHDKGGNFVMFPTDSSSLQFSMWTAIALISKAGIASDPFFISSGFSSGVIEALISCVFILLLTQISLQIYLKTWVFGQAYTYPDVWVYSFGSRARWFPIFVIILTYIAFVIFHTYELYFYMSEFLRSIWEGVPAILQDSWFLIYVMTFVTAVPCLFVKGLASFTVASWISLFCIVVGVICAIVALVRSVNSVGFDPEKQLTWFTGDRQKLFDCISKFNTAFFAHPFMPYILKDLKNPTFKRCLGATWWTNIISTILHFVMGLVGYLCFIPDLTGDDNIFYFMPGVKDPEVVIGKVACYIVSILSNAYYVYFLACQVSSIILEETEIRVSANVLSGLVVITFSIAMNMVDEYVIVVADNVGNIAFLILAYILPTAFYLVQFKFTNIKWAVAAIAVTVLGLAVSIVIMYYDITAP